MASTSCKEAASALLAQCIAGEITSPELLARLADDECSEALFGILVEGLADPFKPRLCDFYKIIAASLLQSTAPELKIPKLLDRYERVRLKRVCRFRPKRVVVLSRVTLGADIAITSVMLDAAKQRFPDAEIYLAGSVKAAELFAQDSRILHLDAPYPRAGTLRDRLDAWRALRAQIGTGNVCVIDPDSRLTQLGMLPIGPNLRYFLFESRAYGGESDLTLTALAQRWAAETFGVSARAYMAPPFERLDAERSCVTVSLGVGGNAAKQLPAAFEAEMMRLFCSRFRTVMVDRGFAVEESSRVDRAIVGTHARTFEGSFARFASLIGQSDCYVGYDSAGQHAAAAAGVPLVTLFKGFVSDRMFARWQPDGPGPKRVLKIEDAISIEDVAAAIEALGF